ncbi:MAG: hypothetical protein HY520_01365 [Candidatus Aenigmarchaeota archaeon]|nr:hypothetical protein [Candidatus Aenigmarchaeota archaeon]
MPTRWTRPERRRHVRRKYYHWKEKIFTAVLCIGLVLITLSMAIMNFSGNIRLELVSGALIFLGVLVSFGVVWGERTIRSPSILAILALMVVVIAITSLAAGWPVFERLAASAVVGVLFLVILGLAFFFVDTATYENE